MTDMQAYDPFDELKRIQDRIDSKFGSQFEAMGMNPGMSGTDMRPEDNDIIVTVDMPRVDIRQQGNEIVMTLDMPDVDENDIDIEVLDDRILEISAQKIENFEEEKTGFLHPERRHMFYCRSIMLPMAVDKTKTKKSFNNGVLEISIPVIRKTSPGEIPVSGV